MSVEAQRAGGRAADPHRSKSLLSDVAPCRRDMSRGATVPLHAERCSIISVVPLYLSVCVCYWQTLADQRLYSLAEAEPTTVSRPIGRTSGL